MKKLMTITCNPGKDCCTDVFKHEDGSVTLRGRGKTEGEITIPADEFAAFKKAIKKDKL